MKQRFLVVGGDGLIGAALARHLEARSDAVYRTTRRASVAERTMRLDLARLDREPETLAALAKLGGEGHFAAFIAAAMTGFDQCEKDPIGSRRVNVEYTCLLANHLVDAGAFVVFLSSNAIFSGENGPPSERDAPDPRTEYGRQKAEAEARLLAAHTSGAGDGRVAVVRLTKVVSTEQRLVRDWLNALRGGGSIEAASDLRLSPISLKYTIQGLARVAELRRGGIFHLSGTRTVTYHDFARCLARLLTIPDSSVRAVEIQSRLGPIPTPVIGGLAMDRTRELLGIAPQPMESAAEDLLAC